MVRITCRMALAGTWEFLKCNSCRLSFHWYFKSHHPNAQQIMIISINLFIIQVIPRKVVPINLCIKNTLWILAPRNPILKKGILTLKIRLFFLLTGIKIAFVIVVRCRRHAQLYPKIMIMIKSSRCYNGLRSMRLVSVICFQIDITRSQRNKSG